MHQTLPVPILVILTLVPFAVCVRINGLNVPRIVLNGTSHALLDCDYSLAPSESGLVVRWFLNNDPVPVYQWIPHQVPRGLGVLRGRVEPGAGAVGTPTAHRALFIRSPTTELSGDWKCLVSTFLNEDFMTKRMIVFAPETQLELRATPISDDGYTNVSCRVTEVYPEPRLSLFKDNSSTGGRKPLAGVTVLTQARPSDYDISAWALVEPDSSPESGGTTVTCVLRIPEANYSRFESLDLSSGHASTSAHHPKYLVPVPALLLLVMASF